MRTRATSAERYFLCLEGRLSLGDSDSETGPLSAAPVVPKAGGWRRWSEAAYQLSYSASRCATQPWPAPDKLRSAILTVVSHLPPLGHGEQVGAISSQTPRKSLLPESGPIVLGMERPVYSESGQGVRQSRLKF